MSASSQLPRLRPQETGVGVYCAPGPASQQEQQWLLVFDDVDRANIPFSDGMVARETFARYEANGWNCYLFVLAHRAPIAK